MTGFFGVFEIFLYQLFNVFSFILLFVFFFFYNSKITKLLNLLQRDFFFTQDQTLSYFLLPFIIGVGVYQETMRWRVEGVYENSLCHSFFLDYFIVFVLNVAWFSHFPALQANKLIILRNQLFIILSFVSKHFKKNVP